MEGPGGAAGQAWLEALRPILTALGGAGAFGAFLTLLGRILPSGNRRLDEARDTRVEHLTRIHELETDLQTMTQRWIDSEQRRLLEKQTAVLLEAQLALVRKNAGLQEGAPMTSYQAALNPGTFDYPPAQAPHPHSPPEPKRERLPEAGPQGEEL